MIIFLNKTNRNKKKFFSYHIAVGFTKCVPFFHNLRTEMIGQSHQATRQTNKGKKN
jgi:hypothetical protein